MTKKEWKKDWMKKKGDDINYLIHSAQISPSKALMVVMSDLAYEVQVLQDEVKTLRG